MASSNVNSVVFESWAPEPTAPSQPVDRAPLRITVRPQDARPAVSDATPPRSVVFENWRGESSATDAASDVAKSAWSGLRTGAADLVGTGGNVWSLLDAGMERAGISAEQRAATKQALKFLPGPASILAGPSSAETRPVMQAATGDFHSPQTKLGRYAHTAAEFVPGAAIPGGGGLLGRLSKFGVLPGVASEAAGQRVEGSAAEPYVRGLAAVGTGGAAAMLTRPKTAASTIRGAIPDDVTPQQLDAAENLFLEAQRLGQPITRAEAVQHVTQGATRLGDVQRVVEGQGGMHGFFAPRAAQNEAAFAPVVRSVDPTPTANPSTIGPAIGEAAEATINDVRAGINTATRPLYNQATSQTIDPQLFSLIRTDPVFVEGVRRVRDDPIIGPTLRGHPDNSVAVVDAVKKQLDETGRNLRDPMSGTARNNYAASIVDEGNRGIVAAADIATGSRPGAGVMGSYETAREAQAALRQRYLDPLLQGPLGRLAERDITTKRAIEALFPTNPLPNSASEVESAVSALVRRNPLAARRLVAAHIESVFNESTQNLQSGMNQFGGAGFAAAIRGNPQQAANLEAAVRALPDGNLIWPGFNRFLEVLEAQGTRQRIGSQTAFNAEFLQDMRRGTVAQEAGRAVVTAGASAFKWPARITDTLDRWRLGRGVDEIARLFTVPEAGARFAQIARMPVGSPAAANILARLAILSDTGARAAPSNDEIASRRD